MQFISLKTKIIQGTAAAFLLLSGVTGLAQSVSVSLTASRTTTLLPDGATVPMWGLACGAATAGASCAAINTNTTGWAPPLITVPAGSSLSITLSNNLPVPTSLTIVGQLGGGIGTPKKVASPTHAPVSATWAITGDSSGPVFTPPSQPDRVQSFGEEVTAGEQGHLLPAWNNLRPGTYLIESGTHPSIQGPMGLYGVLVVTKAPANGTAGDAYPAPASPKGLPYDADAVALLSEIDPLQNKAADKAVMTAGFNESAVWNLKDSVSSVSIDTPGAHYTSAPTVTLTGGSGTGATATATIDPVSGQITSIDMTNGGTGYTSAPSVIITGGGGSGAAASAALSLGQSGCSGSAAACYPPVVNYSPRYFLVNGQAFDKTRPGNSGLNIPGTVVTGNVLVRFVNAGLRMHVPTVVGLDMALAAEDGSVLPGKPRVQNEAFLAAGKVMDVLVSPAAANGTYNAASYAIFDRELSLSTNNQRDGGMQAYLLVNGGTAPVPTAAATGAVANPDTYFLVPGTTLTIGSPAQGVLANDVNVYGGQVLSGPAGGNLSFNANGTFSYVPNAGTTVDSFVYYVNGDTTKTALVTLAACTSSCVGGSPVALPDAYSSKIASTFTINRPGVLGNDTDPAGHPLTAVLDGSCSTGAGSLLGAGQVALNADGSFTVSGVSAPGTYKFCYHAVNSQNASSNPVDVEVSFPTGNGLNFAVQDTKTGAAIGDYSWVIEEDTNFHTVPGTTTPPQQGPTLATSFHKSFMPLVATGCTGPISCGTGQTVYDSNPASPTYGQHIPVGGQASLDPSTVALEPGKSYYISVLPGDAGTAFITANAQGGHTMGGSSIPANLASGTTIKVLAEPNPLPPAQLSVIVFEDNNPVNGDIDGTEETQGLGGFQIILQDVQGATGDPSGQMTYDMYNNPLTNSLNGAIDTATHLNMCPISNTASDGAGGKVAIGMIITCPAFESDNRTPSPVAGQALIKNLFPDRFDVGARVGAARLAKGEQWIQTSTLEGTHWNDAFAKAGEPAYFQEYGPPGFHSFIGFINPAHIAALNARLRGTHKVSGRVTNLHMSRPSSEQLFDSNSNVAIAQSTCYVAANSQNGVGAAVAFAVCDGDGNFTLTGLSDGQYQLAVWDQWQDQIINYKSVTVGGSDVAMGDFTVFSWFESLYASEYIDSNQDGIREDGEPGLGQVPFRIRYRSGQISNTNITDGEGNAPFAEVFPLFNWYVAESDTTRYKTTGVHTVNDAGGAVDTAGPYAGYLNSKESFPVPQQNRVAGSVYCASADCTDVNLSTNPTGGGPGGSTGRIDQGTNLSEGIQGFISQPQFLDYGKTPYSKKENGGIVGHVVYSSTRPFDDPQLLFQNLWEPLIPRVTVNLYRESTAADGTQGLTLVDSTQTSSWDDWANGNRPNSAIANMNCPGQDPNDPFFTQTLGPSGQYRCYDSMHNWNQMQPAPYDGRYQFPSAQCLTPGGSFTTASGKVVSCITSVNPANSDAGNLTNIQYPAIMPTGKYVVEVEVPSGYEIVKEEDKNILIGDSFTAPVSQQFAGFGNVFILPDQAAVAEEMNSSNPGDPTSTLGRNELSGFGPGGLLVMSAPCVGNLRVVPDYLSLFPQSGEVAPFAGSSRHLCDRRELILDDQMQAQTDFFVFTPTPISSRFTGIILDDLASEFNAASPDFGEKFAVPFVPVSFRDFNGVEVTRTYADQFGTFNGLIYSTWDVNPPNPTGYAPNMMITCMNDPGPILDPKGSGKMVTDPMYNPNYSNFCYTWPFMPGTESYMDTPVLPVAAYAAGYNPPDCAYPDATPAISEVNGDGAFGPYLKSNGPLTLTIKALGDTQVSNNAYGGPGSTAAPANVVNITRHYGFGTQGPLSTVTLPSTTANAAPVALQIVSWSDGQIVAKVPVNAQGVPLAKTGELMITATVSDPKGGQKAVKSVDSVTVTIENPTVAGYRAPTYIYPPAAQTATATGLPHPIQDAIDAAQPGDLLMLAPGSYPELVIMWKPIRLQGVGAASVTINAAKYPTQKLEAWRPRINCFFGLDGLGNALTGATAECPATQLNSADPLPGQEITGGVLLLEPSVLTGVQGPGITVLAKNLGTNACTPTQRGYKQSNFACADDNITGNNHHLPHARIDGISLTGSDAGGGIYVNGWAHNLEIANDRIHGNSGTLAGGILIGQPYLEGTTGAGPFGYDKNVLIHHNSITQNGSVEANTGQSGAGGGLSLCTGTDNYSVNYNFICGNFSEGDGGGIGHIGLSWNGSITNNQILFNESFIQASTTSGGGIAIEGETGNGIGVSLGTGNVTVDSNYILGNDAQGGHGGGIRLQDVNGADVQRSPNFPGSWWKVTLENNMIVNNVAGWSGGGISLENTVNSVIVNNTVSSNDSTATAGPVFTSSTTTTTFQPAGISAEPHSAALCAVLNQSTNAAYRCTGTQGHSFSNPTLQSNIVWRNRSFYFTSTTPDPNNPTGVMNTLMPNLVQTTTGDCPTGANYWDLGVLGQPQASPLQKLSPTYSVLSNSTGYDATNKSGDPLLLHQYCNGSRVPPQTAGDLMSPQEPFSIQPIGAEDEGGNWVNLRFGPLSLVDSSVINTPGTLQSPIGDYHIQANSSAQNAVPCSVGSVLSPSHDFDGNARPSPKCSSPTSTALNYDMGAIELQSTGAPIATVTAGPVAFGNVPVNTVSAAKTLTLQNTGTGDLTGITVTVTGAFSRSGGSCTTTLVAGSTCSINVVFSPTALTAYSGSVAIGNTSNVTVTNAPVALTGTGVAQVVSGNLSPGSWTPTQTRNCPGTTFLQRAACALDPTMGFTLTNNGNVPLNNISTVSLSGVNLADYTILPAFTTCGTGAGQFTNVTTLAPAANCTITVQFKPLLAEAIGTKNAKVNVTDAAGTQSSFLLGVAK